VYTFDAPTLMGYIAAKTERVEIGSGILPIYSRTPTLTAMTAAGLDSVSGGARCSASARPGRRSSRAGTACPTTSRWPAPRDRGDLSLGVAPRVVQHQGIYNLPLPAGQAPASASRSS